MRLQVFLPKSSLRVLKKSQHRQQDHFVIVPQPQQQSDHGNAISRLPDEILLKILLLAVPGMDLEGIRITANVSHRFRQLSMELMCRFMLPGIQVSTLIDQEGRRKFRTLYHFHCFDDSTLVATFKPDSRQVPRRVRGNNYAALPVLRQLAVSPTYYHRPPGTIAHHYRQLSCHTINSSSSFSTTTSTTTIDAANHSSTKIMIKPKSLQIAKPGNHVSAPNRKMNDAILSWELHYAVDPVEDSTDRYIAPTDVRVHMSMLSRALATISKNGLSEEVAAAAPHTPKKRRRSRFPVEWFTKNK